MDDLFPLNNPVTSSDPLSLMNEDTASTSSVKKVKKKKKKKHKHKDKKDGVPPPIDLSNSMIPGTSRNLLDDRLSGMNSPEPSTFKIEDNEGGGFLEDAFLTVPFKTESLDDSDSG